MPNPIAYAKNMAKAIEYGKEGKDKKCTLHVLKGMVAMSPVGLIAGFGINQALEALLRDEAGIAEAIVKFLLENKDSINELDGDISDLQDSVMSLLSDQI